MESGGISSTASQRIDIAGTVQGVGFRPFVWRLATELDLTGTVRNVNGHVEIDLYGSKNCIETFITRIPLQAPPLARVDSIQVSRLPDGSPPPPRGFTVVPSATESKERQPDRLFPPDIALCEACLEEMRDPTNRRYRYPFINCTDCGPRATIVESLPYDRVNTTMAEFPLCPECRAEYVDPANRRFHAEPVACPCCGPTLTWSRSPAAGPPLVGEEALVAAARAITAGGVIAVKGLGGYHLACDATSESAVRLLRWRKRRWAKPLAVMVADLGSARSIATVSAEAERELLSPARPIVLVEPADPAGGEAGGNALAPSVQAGMRSLGLFLPYTGLHHLLLADVSRPIVLTSGNLSDEPIARDDDEAEERLGPLVDGFLAHNRRIRSRYEDSVVACSPGGTATIRRGRGAAPAPLALPVPAPEPVLAMGAQLKHTFTLARGQWAHVSAHIGDLSDLASLSALQDSLDHLGRMLAVEPQWVAHDPHPRYLSTRQALERYPAERTIPVWHHHAHVAACMVEHGLTEPVIGVAMDGLGLGDDGTLWGGEVLVCDLVSFRRAARFGRAPMPGGEAAVRQPWRMALGYLLGAEDLQDQPAGRSHWWGRSPWIEQFDPRAVAVIRGQISRGVNAPIASSAGRLFDAASALLGICHTSEYEGHAAVLLEQAADRDERGALPYRIVTRHGLAVYDPRPTLAALLDCCASGVGVPRVAARFQNAIARATAELVGAVARETGLGVVCLSGGVFANMWLLTEIPRLLGDRGLAVLQQHRVPSGDGGISLGQAAVASARLAAGALTGRREDGHHVSGSTWQGPPEVG